MAEIRNAIGNVFNTVATVSSTVSNTVQLIGKGANAGNAWMDEVLKRQALTLKADTAIFEQTYRATKAQQLAALQIGIAKWAKENPEAEQYYKDALAVIDHAIAQK